MDSEPQFTLDRMDSQDFDLGFGFLQSRGVDQQNSPHSSQKSNKSLQPKHPNQFNQINHNQDLNSLSHPKLRAINPLQKFKDYPQAQRQSITNFFMHNKVFPGLLGVFGQTHERMFQPISQDLFGNMDDQIFQSPNQTQGLRKLFNQGKQSSQFKLLDTLSQLQVKINDVHKKIFSSISFNKTIGLSFFDHFQNFAFLQNQSEFINNFQESIKNFVFHAKKIRGPGIDLVLSIYQFWMRGFRDFVNQIWKHSEKFALNFFKKRKGNDELSQKSNEQQINDYKSSTSSQVGCEKQKRKQWTQKQIQILNRMIDSHTIFSNDKLRQLSEQFGRTTSSISSKIQKILKQKKIQQGQSKHGDVSLFKKISQVLTSCPQGLNKDQVIQKMNIEYQMGIDDSWKKSVTQLLSSNKQITKKKGTFKIRSQDIKYLQNSNKTFKDRVIQCLLNCPNNQGDLKTISQKYLDLYGLSQGYHIYQIEKIKTLEANISKTLCRYDIFDKSKSRTLYFYNLLIHNNGKQAMEQQIDHYLS